MEALKTEQEPVAIKRLRRKLKGKQPSPGNDPIDTLRIITRQHRNTSKIATAIGHMGLSSVTLKDGTVVERQIPPDVSAELEAVAKSLQKKAQGMKAEMQRALRGIPIYEHFFKQVTFTVPVLASYLVTDVDVRGPLARRHNGPGGIGEKGEGYKPSGLRRFCGLAVIDGHLERLQKGQKRGWNATIRTCLYMAFDSLWKNQRHCEDSKYLKIWKDAKHRSLHLAGVEEHGEKPNGEAAHRRLLDTGKHVPWDGHAHSYGWHKAADVLIEDLYIVWRALEGLPVWPSYYAAKLGYEHGGKISVNAPKLLTLDEAKELVGLKP